MPKGKAFISRFASRMLVDLRLGIKAYVVWQLTGFLMWGIVETA
jgi:hypothetical protein